MAAEVRDTVETFGARFTGRTILPSDADYDVSRSIWNGAIDRRPAVIASCTTPAQVADAIRFARGAGLELSVRGGGHNYAGHAVSDGGVMIHLGRMNQVSVDLTTRRAICGGGATWADVDAATQLHGLATPGGFISHTGIGGLTLGGGIGWLTKEAGLSSDNLVSAELVTADGRVLRVSRSENPELHWALRGGGGNFGVVTSFEFELYPVGPEVNFGFFFFGLDRGAEALTFANEYIKTLPPHVTAFIAAGLDAPPAPFVPEAFRGRLGHALIVVGFGAPEEHQAAIEPIARAVKPLFELVTPMPFVQLQQLFNEGLQWGTFGYEKALYLEDLSPAAVKVIGDHVAHKHARLSFCPTFTLGGAYRNHADDDSAFGGSRAARYVFNINASAPDRTLYEKDRAWARTFWEAMKPHAMSGGGYLNFQSDIDEGRTRLSYGAEKYQRLAELKRQYDPENVFHLNANIKPALPMPLGPGGPDAGTRVTRK